MGRPYSGDDTDDVRSRSSAIALRTFGRSRALGLRVLGALPAEGGPRISNWDIVVDWDSFEFLRRCLGLLLGSGSGLAGGGIMTGSSGMFFTLLSTADNGGDGVGGGGAIS